MAVATAVALAGCTGVTPTDASAGATVAPSSPAVRSAPPTAPRSPRPGGKQGFDRTARSTTDPASLWVIVNKKHPLVPVDYAPTDLVYPALVNVNHQPVRRPAAGALAALFAAARREAGLSLAIQSAYRSYATQLQVYDDWVASAGPTAAGDLSAKPGTSEHQTGLAVDLSAVPEECTLAACFGATPHGRWLAANAWRFGFVLRYPADKVAVTGYDYEPWHFRYVGAALAAELHREGNPTLEEFFGTSGGG
jgi:D-alanyl-D-alanine carboxypeptidase